MPCAIDSEASSDHAKGQIAREVTAGFRRGDYVLRVARVVVAE